MTASDDALAAELLSAAEASQAHADRLEAAVAALERRNAELEAVANRVQLELAAKNAKRIRAMVEARTIPPEQRAEELAAVVELSQTLPARLSAYAARPRIARTLGLPVDRVKEYQRVLSLFEGEKLEATFDPSRLGVGN